MSSRLYNYYWLWPAVPYGPTHMLDKLENVTIIVGMVETKFIAALYKIPQKWNSAGKAEREDGYWVAQALPPLQVFPHCSSLQWPSCPQLQPCLCVSHTDSFISHCLVSPISFVTIYFLKQTLFEAFAKGMNLGLSLNCKKRLYETNSRMTCSFLLQNSYQRPKENNIVCKYFHKGTHWSVSPRNAQGAADCSFSKQTRSLRQWSVSLGESVLYWCLFYPIRRERKTPSKQVKGLQVQGA